MNAKPITGQEPHGGHRGNSGKMAKSFDALLLKPFPNSRKRAPAAARSQCASETGRSLGPSRGDEGSQALYKGAMAQGVSCGSLASASPNLSTYGTGLLESGHLSRARRRGGGLVMLVSSLGFPRRMSKLCPHWPALCLHMVLFLAYGPNFLTRHHKP